MKTKILSFLFVLGLGLFMANSAFAIDDATNVSKGATINYNVTASVGTADHYIWTVSAGGTLNSGQGTTEISVTWNTAGAQTVTVQMLASNGCLSDKLTRNVTVNDSKWDLTSPTNPTTCALITTPIAGTSGNDQPSLATPGTDLSDFTSFAVTIQNPSTGAHVVAYTVADNEGTPNTVNLTATGYTSGGTITITHNTQIPIFSNTTGSNKTVTITVTSVTDVNGATVNYGGTLASYTVTVHPIPTIAF